MTLLRTQKTLLIKKMSILKKQKNLFILKFLNGLGVGLKRMFNLELTHHEFFYTLKQTVL